VLGSQPQSVLDPQTIASMNQVLTLKAGLPNSQQVAQVLYN